MTSDDFKYPFFIIKVASTYERETSDAPVSNTKYKGRSLIAHFTLQTPSSFVIVPSVLLLMEPLQNLLPAALDEMPYCLRQYPML